VLAAAFPLGALPAHRITHSALTGSLWSLGRQTIAAYHCPRDPNGATQPINNLQLGQLGSQGCGLLRRHFHLPSQTPVSQRVVAPGGLRRGRNLLVPASQRAELCLDLRPAAAGKGWCCWGSGMRRGIAREGTRD
jgi:hypothetical protein